MKTAYERVTELVSGVGVRLLKLAAKPEAEDDARRLEWMQFPQPSAEARPEPPDELIEQEEELLALRT